MSSNFENLPYRPCVGIVLFNGDGLVFVGERIDNPGAWQMPQGGIDEGEDIKTAAIRELHEEIGTDKAKILKIAEETICYDLPPHLIEKLWNGRFRGQEQSWIAMRFTGEDSDIDIRAHARPEFMAWQWVEINQITDLIVPFKKEAYGKVIDLFKKYT